MAIGDISRRVLTKFDADTRDLERGIDRVQDKSKEAGRGFTAMGESLGGFVRTGLSSLANLGLSFDTVSRAVAFTRDAIKGWGEDLRLEARNVGISIDRLNVAFGEMLDEDSINQFAARAANGALKLTQQQMETVAQAAVVLRERGFDLKESLDKLTDAAVTGRTRGLAELGLEVEKGTTKFETAKNMMAELNKVIADSVGPTSREADEVEKLGKAWADATDSAKNYIAQAATAFIKNDFKIDFRNPAAMLSGMIDPNKDWGVAGSEAWRKRYFEQSNEFQNARYQQLIRQYAGGFVGGKNEIRGLQESDELEMIEMSEMDMRRRVRAREEMVKYGDDPSQRNFIDLTPVSFSDKSIDTSFAGLNEDLGKQIETNVAKIDESLLTVEERYANFLAGQPTILEKLGLTDTDAWDAARGAIEGFSSSYVEAMRGVAQGSLDAEGALKMVAGKTVAAVGDKLLAMGAAELAQAAAMTATYNPAAALHYTAAGLYTAGGLAAHVAASAIMGKPSESKVDPKATGGSGGGGSSSGSSAGSGGGSGGGSGNGGRDVVYVYGDPFAQDSPRNRALTAERAIRRVLPNFGEDS